jgi:C4-dicarboxylate transporter DctM subunit
MVALLFGALLVLMLIGLPVAFALAMAAALTLQQGALMPLLIVPQEMIRSVNSFTLLAIPFFILAGYLMQGGGISRRLVDFSNALVGASRGGLAIVAIVTSLFFAAISGSGTATTAAVGSILIPAMIAQGYSREFAAANQAASGALGVIIPPSIPLILYAIAANASVGDMFLAGILPGLLVALSLVLYARFRSGDVAHAPVRRASLAEVGVAGARASLAIAMPVIILGGIYGGIVTPTEAAVIAVVYSLVVGVFIYREIAPASLPGIFLKSAVTSASVLIIISAAGLYGRVIQRLGVPALMSDWATAAIDSRIVFLILVNLLLLVAGMFLEAAAAILIFVPILLPIALGFGVDPVHFGVIMVVNLAMGMFTPPVGLNLFVAAQISGAGIARLSRAVLPFVLLVLANVLLISFWPWLSLAPLGR